MTRERRDRGADRRPEDRYRRTADPSRQPQQPPPQQPNQQPHQQGHVEMQPPQGVGQPPQSPPAVQPPQTGTESTQPQRVPEPVPIPAIDVYESDEAVTVLVDLPGCDEDDIRIRAENDQLTVVAERDDVPENGASVVQRERPTSFRRTVPIPAEADLEGASANYDDGVCTVTFPTTDRRSQREIGFQ